MLTIDPGALENARKALDRPESAENIAICALLARAKKALGAPLETVTAKSFLPPSGDRRDYMSLGSYWWPNPDTADGLPYVRRDGARNPASLSEDVDESRLTRMANTVLDLALAFHFTANSDFSAKAVDFLRAWFLEEKTRMNPNLRFGQSVPGVAEGRGLGLIDTRCLWRVIDSALMLEACGLLDRRDMEGLRDWFHAFRRWMHTHPLGHDEYIWHNNHGTYFDVQSVNYALFTGDTASAREMLYDAVHRRMASQILRDGTQPAELERTRPFHYSIFNLIGHFRLARYGEIAGFDYLNATQDGRSLRGATEFMIGQIAAPEARFFPAREDFLNELTLRFVLQAENLFGLRVQDNMVLAELLAGNAREITCLAFGQGPAH
ncbi:alginate lyase family protein [Martelella radicis]|uniref:Alginate lyase domain-containing protein n=1 Tax=Martelella radicis TaxID=1397476 RepID=A0A7W6KM50_9HYPH|nr:alginate lyase family protein [Martelella radicis]MBB4123722.1 hypothetical protein [Martelella radicis]